MLQLNQRLAHPEPYETVDKFVWGRLEGSGWPSSMYGVSKVCEATYSRLLADELRPRTIAVNACCPGCASAQITCLVFISQYTAMQ